MKVLDKDVIGVAVHDGIFHADEVFAIAALIMYFDVLYPDQSSHFNTIRTRNRDELDKADYRIDVGGKYDPDTGDFDHHQQSDYRRQNGVPFAAFGLVWKSCGKVICGGDQAVADFIDARMVLSIDGQDNGAAALLGGHEPINVFSVSSLIGIFNQTWDSTDSQDAAFYYTMDLARLILIRLVSYAKSVVKANGIIREAVNAAGDSLYITIDQPDLPWGEVICELAGDSLLYVVCACKNGHWQVRCVEDDGKHRKSFPESWAGLEGAELVEVTGVENAVFCHQRRFICSASSREGAIALAETATRA